MNRSLSALVPVYNGQATVAPLVGQLLEVLPELTPDFDVVIIDDGSTDATPEVAHDMAIVYPQVQFIRHPKRWDHAASMRTGLLHSGGSVILFRPQECGFDLGGLDQLWQAIRSCDLAIVCREAEPQLRPAFRRHDCVRARQPQVTALHMIRRQALDRWRQEADDEDWLGFLLRHGFRCQQVNVPPAAGTGDFTSPVRRLRDRGLVQSQPSRPNYLTRLKAFAWGE